MRILFLAIIMTAGLKISSGLSIENKSSLDEFILLLEKVISSLTQLLALTGPGSPVDYSDANSINTSEIITQRTTESSVVTGYIGVSTKLNSLKSSYETTVVNMMEATDIISPNSTPILDENPPNNNLDIATAINPPKNILDKSDSSFTTIGNVFTQQYEQHTRNELNTRVHEVITQASPDPVDFSETTQDVLDPVTVEQLITESELNSVDYTHTYNLGSSTSTLSTLLNTSPQNFIEEELTSIYPTEVTQGEQSTMATKAVDKRSIDENDSIPKILTVLNNILRMKNISETTVDILRSSIMKLDLMLAEYKRNASVFLATKDENWDASLIVNILGAANNLKKTLQKVKHMVETTQSPLTSDEKFIIICAFFTFSGTLILILMLCLLKLNQKIHILNARLTSRKPRKCSFLREETSPAPTRVSKTINNQRVTDDFRQGQFATQIPSTRNDLSTQDFDGCSSSSERWTNPLSANFYSWKRPIPCAHATSHDYSVSGPIQKRNMKSFKKFPPNYPLEDYSP